MISAPKLPLDLLDPPFDEALAVLGGVILGVLGEVALRTRFGDGLDDPGAVNGLELVQFSLELFRAALGNGKGSMFWSCKMRNRHQSPGGGIRDRVEVLV